MEKGLYAQVIMIRQKDMKFVATNTNKNGSKFKFQGQLEISQLLYVFLSFVSS